MAPPPQRGTGPIQGRPRSWPGPRGSGHHPHRTRATRRAGFGAVRPHRQLLARSRPERVRRGQQHGGTTIGQMSRQLADRCGLSGPVHTRHHHHRGLVLANHLGLLQGLQQVCNRIGQQALHRRRVGGLALLDPPFQIAQQEFRGLDPAVGHQQRRFQVFVQGIIDLRAGEHRGQAAASLAQTQLELVQPALARHFRGLGGHRGRLRRHWLRGGRLFCRLLGRCGWFRGRGFFAKEREHISNLRVHRIL